MKPGWLYILLLLFTACKEKHERNKAITHQQSMTGNGIVYKDTELSVSQMINCRYPDKDPVFEQKKNKKIVVLEIQIKNVAGAAKEDMIPSGAMILDSKGNSYPSWPGAIAMAQNNECIPGDDLKAYNSIWNGEINSGETVKAFALGFELPADAKTEKLIWNKKWGNANILLELHTNNFTINH